MADLTGFPWALNQPVPAGSGYGAEQLRAKHYDETSGGNGVGSPGALKVTAQTAPDGTVRVVPGGATVRSTYAGQEGQSFHTYFGNAQTLPVSPTGSASGGRRDLVAVQVCDPDVDTHWDYAGEYPIPAAVAATMRFQRVHVFEGMNRDSVLPHPFVKLAEINRPPNTTIVSPQHIIDLRELANPKHLVVPMVKNIGNDTHTAEASGNYNTLAEFFVDTPDWANRAVVDGTLAGCFVNHPNGGVTGNFDFDGLGSFVGGSQGDFQQTGWGAAGSVTYERIDFHAGGEVVIDPERRGTVQRVRLRVRIPTSAPSGSKAGTEPQSLAKLTITFKQGVS